jgi:hypothetical protein
MKKIFFVFCLVLSFIANAQLNNGKYAGNDGATKNMEFYDNNGNLIPIGFHPNIDGSPMLFHKPGIGKIIFQNNAKLTDSSLNYSLVDDKLYFIRLGKYYAFKQPVKEFTLQFPEDSSKIMIYHFKSGFPKTDKLESTALYELIFEGKDFQLLKWQHKKVEEHSNYGSASDKEFVTDIVYYLYLPSKGKMEKLGLKISQNDLKKLLPTYTSKIDSYLSQHKINFKKDSDLLPLFQFIESD